MNGRTLNFDPIRRTRQVFHANPDGSFAVETKQDVSEILADAAGRRQGDSGNWRGEMHHVAQIPTSVYFALPKALRDDPKALKRWLDHPDQAAFRTKPGALSR